jgi:hypothetical protein
MIKLTDILLRERKILSVFDFDDTLAKADAWIYVMKDGREIKKLDPAQFAVYTPRPGETFDFRDFDKKLQNPRLIRQNAELLIKQLDKARRSARGSRKVTILTARRIGAPVSSFLKSIGINAYVVPVGSSDPKVKANWIEKQINKGYDTVYFMDDSPKNVRAVDMMLNKYPNIKRRSVIKLIKEAYPKNKYIEPSDSQKDELKQTLFKLIQTAYAPIGGHLKFKTPDDIKDPDLKYWKMADIDQDPEIDVVYFGKKTPFGIKHTGIGHDGEKPNIKKLLIKKSAELRTSGNYVEVSKGAFDSFVGKGKVPIIDDEETVRKVLGDRRSKETTWHGEHPKGTYPGNGWYTRIIGGKEVIKTMIGKV